MVHPMHIDELSVKWLSGAVWIVTGTVNGPWYFRETVTARTIQEVMFRYMQEVALKLTKKPIEA